MISSSFGIKFCTYKVYDLDFVFTKDYFFSPQFTYYKNVYIEIRKKYASVLDGI